MNTRLFNVVIRSSYVYKFVCILDGKCTEYKQFISQKLGNATLNSLKVAGENGLKSIGFPAISIDVFGFPIERCAEIILSTTIDYLQGETKLERVVFCLYGEEAFGVRGSGALTTVYTNDIRWGSRHVFRIQEDIK